MFYRPQQPPPTDQGLMLALEPRIMLDGAALTTAIEISEEEQGTTLFTPATAPPTEIAASTTQLIIIDGSVPDGENLVAGVDSSIPVYTLQRDQSGILQITAILQQYDNLEAVHIFSHGSSGSLQLGNTLLNGETVTTHQDSLQQWGAHLSTTGDLLLYGCEVGKGESGATFIEEIARLTEADVAASDDLTGGSILGGDWNLEINFGTIESESITPEDYNHTLAKPGLTQTDTTEFPPISNSIGPPTSGETDNTITISSLFTKFEYTDGDGTNPNERGIAITGFPNSSVVSNLWYSTDGGDNWDTVDRIPISEMMNSDYALIVLTESTDNLLYIEPHSSATGLNSAAFNFKAWDPTAKDAAGNPLTNGAKKIDTTGTDLLSEPPYSNNGDYGYRTTFTTASATGVTGSVTESGIDSAGETVTTSALIKGEKELFSNTSNFVYPTKLKVISAGTDANNLSTVDNGGLEIVGDYGTITMKSDGSYQYDLDNNNVDVNGLQSGEKLTDIFKAKLSDGTDEAIQTLTITINGTNDAPTSSGELVNSDAREAGIDDSGNVVTGTGASGAQGALFVNLLDADTTNNNSVSSVTKDSTTTSVNANSSSTSSPSTVSGTYGNLSVGADGSYLYSVNNSLAAVQKLQKGDTAEDHFTVTIKDGYGGTVEQSLKITINGTNDSPSTTTNTGARIPDGTSTIITSSHLSSDDADNADSTIYYTITSAPTHGTLWLDSNYNGQLDNTEQALSTSNHFTEKDITSNTLRYAHNNSTSGKDEIQFKLSNSADGGATNQIETFSISYSPLLTLNSDTPIEYREDEPKEDHWIKIGEQITLSDSDNDITQLTIKITNFQTGDILQYGSNTYSTGTLTINTPAGTSPTTNDWQTAIQSIQYKTTNDNPTLSAAERTIEWGVTDSLSQGNSVTNTITITPTNDLLKITSGESIEYTEDTPEKGHQIQLSPKLTLEDPDSTLTEASVKLSNLTDDDTLGFINNNTTMGDISASYDSDTGILKLSSANESTLEQWQSALRSITFSTINDDPTTVSNTRTVTWEVKEKGGNTVAAESTITITPVNDAPELTNVSSTLSFPNPTTDISVNKEESQLLDGASDLDDKKEALLISEVNGSALNVGQPVSIPFQYTHPDGTVDTFSMPITIFSDGSYKISLTDFSPLPKDGVIKGTFSYRIADQAGAASQLITPVIEITGVNDSPVITDTTPISLDNSILEPSGSSVRDIISKLAIDDPDFGSQQGVALTGTTQGYTGKWQISTSSGADWKTIEALSDSHALLLPAVETMRIRYVNGLDHGSGEHSIQVRAWDREAPTIGSNTPDAPYFDLTPSLNQDTGSFSNENMLLTASVPFDPAPEPKTAEVPPHQFPHSPGEYSLKAPPPHLLSSIILPPPPPAIAPPPSPITAGAPADGPAASPADGPAASPADGPAASPDEEETAPLPNEDAPGEPPPDKQEQPLPAEEEYLPAEEIELPSADEEGENETPKGEERDPNNEEGADGESESTPKKRIATPPAQSSTHPPTTGGATAAGTQTAITPPLAEPPIRQLAPQIQIEAVESFKDNLSEPLQCPLRALDNIYIPLEASPATGGDLSSQLERMQQQPMRENSQLLAALQQLDRPS